MKKPTLFICSLFLLGIAHSINASVLLDFGSTTATGGDLTNSPGHSVSAYLSGSDTSWNTVGTSGGLTGSVSGLVDSQGNAASGVSFTWGASTGSSPDLLRYNETISSSNALGSSVNTGVYAGSSVGKDGIFNGNSSAALSIGLRLDGLAAGNYEVYLTGINTNAADPVTAYFGVGNITTMDGIQPGSSTYFDYGDSYPTVGGDAISDPSLILSVAMTNSSTDTWISGDNYAMALISLSSGDSLFIAVDGGSARGFLNSLEIVSVAVPEPSAYAMVFGVLGLSFVAFKYRRR